MGRCAGLFARRKDPGTALRLPTLVVALLETPARQPVLARPRATAQRDHDANFLDWRHAGWLSRQCSRHAHEVEGSDQSNCRAMEPFFSERRGLWTASGVARPS